MAVVPKTESEQLGVDPTPEEQAEIEAQEAAAQQEAEAAKAEAEEEAARPEWLKEKFKTPEDMAKSYDALENELRERGTREREMAARMEQLEAFAQQAERQPQAQADDPMAVYASELELARENGDARREAELQAWLVQQTINQAFQANEANSRQQQGPIDEITADYVKRSVASQFEDFSDYEQRVGERLRDEPWRLSDQVLESPQLMRAAITDAYKAVKYDDLIERQKALEEQGISAEDLSRARKLGAQTLTGSSGRPGEPSEADKQLAEINAGLRGQRW